MESYLFSGLYDLITPDGFLSRYEKVQSHQAKATLFIRGISPAFKGFEIPKEQVSFNLKSILAQIGLQAINTAITLDAKTLTAEVELSISAYGNTAKQMLDYLSTGSYIGKLFAADERRKVKNADYLLRMFHRTDRQGRPLLYLGEPQNSDELLLEKKEGYMIAKLSLLDGTISYHEGIEGLIPTLGKALEKPHFRLRSLLQLLQVWNQGSPKVLQADQILLVKTRPLHIRTVFGRVRQDLLPEGFSHTSANILQPDTKASGDVYEFFGSSSLPIQTIPLEFFTLEPHREHVFFSDRDQLQSCLENKEVLFSAFQTAPTPPHHKAALFISKGSQLLSITSKDWIAKEPHFYEFPGMIYDPDKQALLVRKYIEQQPTYPFLKAIEAGLITSQGILLSRFFPSPLLKKTFLEEAVQHCLKGIYFEQPSSSYGDFFSHEDRSMLLDLAKFAIPVYWVDKGSQSILQYVPKPNKDTGMFVPLAQVEAFIKAASFGVYGSNLLSGHLESELFALFQGLEKMRPTIKHPLFNASTPIALITGGGPGVMEIGNKVAKTLGLLSCANLVDFRSKDHTVVNEQIQNPYIDIKMTYRLDHLVERQAEFNLDFPIFLEGGIGTDFEYSLEELRRKVGSAPLTPILLLGDPNYWKQKISSRFQCNLSCGTIAGSEWVSNSFYCIKTAKQGLKVYEKFFSNALPIGKEGPIYQEGFAIV